MVSAHRGATANGAVCSVPISSPTGIKGGVLGRGSMRSRGADVVASEAGKDFPWKIPRCYVRSAQPSRVGTVAHTRESGVRWDSPFESADSLEENLHKVDIFYKFMSLCVEQISVRFIKGMS